MYFDNFAEIGIQLKHIKYESAHSKILILVELSMVINYKGLPFNYLISTVPEDLKHDLLPVIV